MKYEGWQERIQTRLETISNVMGEQAVWEAAERLAKLGGLKNPIAAQAASSSSVPPAAKLATVVEVVDNQAKQSQKDKPKKQDG